MWLDLNIEIVRLCQIGERTICWGLGIVELFTDIPWQKSISFDFMYIENIQLIGINKIIADTKLIHATGCTIWIII